MRVSGLAISSDTSLRLNGAYINAVSLSLLLLGNTHLLVTMVHIQTVLEQNYKRHVKL